MNLVYIIPLQDAPEVAKEQDTLAARNWYIENGRWATVEKLNKDKTTSYTSPRYSEMFLKDGRVGFVIDKDIHINSVTALVIDKDRILKEYTFDRTDSNIIDGYGLPIYKYKN